MIPAIPTLSMQVLAIAAESAALRLSRYQAGLRNIGNPRDRARKIEKDRIALEMVAARPGLTSGDLALRRPEVTRQVWSRHLIALVERGLLLTRDLPPPRRRHGPIPNRYVITEPGRAMLADLQRLAASEDQSLNQSTNQTEAQEH